MACAAAPVRILVRPTHVYMKLLTESFHPYLLQDALDRDRKRLREVVTRKQKGKGKNTLQRRRYKGEWREPKLLTVYEIDDAGKVVWSYKLDLAGRPPTPGHEGHGTEVFNALRRPDGNTIIAGGSGNQQGCADRLFWKWGVTARP